MFDWVRRRIADYIQMHLETSSGFYGETVCPFNRRLTSGGSSGGEGALLGMRGSCMGIGTDIGVSVRVLLPVLRLTVVTIRVASEALLQIMVSMGLGQRAIACQ